jgi:hypothetical protein
VPYYGRRERNDHHAGPTSERTPYERRGADFMTSPTTDAPSNQYDTRRRLEIVFDECGDDGPAGCSVLTPDAALAGSARRAAPRGPR